MKMYKYKDIYKDIHIYFSEDVLKNRSHKEELKKALLSKEREQEVVENKEKFKFNFMIPSFKYSLTAFSLALVFVVFLILYNLFFDLPSLESKVLSFNGTVQIKGKNKNNYIYLTSGRSINSGDTLRSTEGANADVIINNNSIINIYESSELKLIELDQIKKAEKIKLYLSKGSIYCTVNLPTKNSNFDVLTDSSNFTVRGTKFLICILENRDIKLNVDESSVEVGTLFKPLKKLRKIAKIDKSVYQKLLDVFNYRFMVNTNESVLIKNGIVERINLEFSTLVNDVYTKIINNDFTDNNRKKTLNKIDELKEEVKTLSNIIKTNEIIKENETVKEVTTITKKESAEKSDGKTTYILTNNNKEMFIGHDVLLETVDGSFLYGVLISHDGQLVKIEDDTLGLIAIGSHQVKKISFRR